MCNSYVKGESVIQSEILDLVFREQKYIFMNSPYFFHKKTQNNKEKVYFL